MEFQFLFSPLPPISGRREGGRKMCGGDFFSSRTLHMSTCAQFWGRKGGGVLWCVGEDECFFAKQGWLVFRSLGGWYGSQQQLPPPPPSSSHCANNTRQDEPFPGQFAICIQKRGESNDGCCSCTDDGFFFCAIDCCMRLSDLSSIRRTYCG